jgi:hypothetical protein
MQKANVKLLQISYSLCSILVIADLVQSCTKSATTNMEWREQLIN